MNNVKILALLINSEGTTIGARIQSLNNNFVQDFDKNYLLLNKDNLNIVNAVITSNGIIRSKTGYGNLDKILYENVITLYHGSPNKNVKPVFGKGKKRHDYGKGFYLTEHPELAKEWAVCNGNNGYLHEIKINIAELSIFDYDKYTSLNWIAELMSHRDAYDSNSYKRFAPIFISKYKIDTSSYDIIKGWRADSSYFRIAKLFVRNELDVSLLDEALHFGDLNIQYCLKSKKAFKSIKSCICLGRVDAEQYYTKYDSRDKGARDSLENLIASERNTLDYTFRDFIKGNVK